MLAPALLLLMGLVDGADRPAGLEACVRLYSERQFDAAVECASRLQARDSNVQQGRLLARTLPPFRRVMLRQLLALHTELVLREERATACAAPVEDEHRVLLPGQLWKPQLVEGLEHPKEGGPPDLEFLVPWYLLAIAYDQGHGFIPAARQCVEVAPPEIRHLPEMQVAEGALSEMECAREAGEDGSKRPSTSCAVAERLYRAALVQAPNMPEAGLRLAKVLIEQGRALEAMDLLPVLTTHPDPDTAYLARMFAALASHRLDDPDSARAFYERAGQPAAETTSSTIGLALLAYRSGDSASARSLLSRDPARPLDPWLWYTKGTARHAVVHRSRLRDLVAEH